MAESKRYPIPAAPFRCEHEIERSRFIISVQPVSTVEEARAFVAAIKAEFPDANHNCWAFLVGPPGSSDRTGMSDDGEPHGTAGKPMLTALLHSALGDIAVVVTRYFGGIKLGTGGLVKAYTHSVQLALQQIPQAEKAPWRNINISLDYAAISAVERELPDLEVQILEKNFAERVTFSLRLPEERIPELVKRLADLTGGKAEVVEAQRMSEVKT